MHGRKSSSVVPVFKNDGDPGKYRHISLLPNNSKIFASFINDSLTKYLDITDFFSDLQYSFHAFRSTADILTVLSEYLQFGGETRAIALDISKAFDKVWHAGLLHKLKASGVIGPSMLEFLLQERSLKVVLDGQSSPLISPMLEFLRDRFWGQPYSCFLLMIFPMRFYQE